MARKGSKELSFEERKIIERLLKENYKTRSIASCLGRSFSGVNQEITRGGGKSKYDAARCQIEADARKKAKNLKISKNFSESEILALNKAISEELSINAITLTTGISNHRVNVYLKNEKISYKKRNFSGVLERLDALEEQIVIISERIEEIYEQINRNK